MDVDKSAKLQNQIKGLIQSERRLYEVQEKLDRQIVYISRLNKWVLNGAGLNTIEQLLNSALKFLISNFVILHGFSLLTEGKSGVTKIGGEYERNKRVSSVSPNELQIKYPSECGSQVLIDNGEQVVSLYNNVYRYLHNVNDIFTPGENIACIVIQADDDSRYIILVHVPDDKKLPYHETGLTKEHLPLLSLLHQHLTKSIQELKYKKLLEESNISLDALVEKRTLELNASKYKYEVIFQDSPVAILEIELSEIANYLNTIGMQKCSELERYFNENEHTMAVCFNLLRILSANKQALNLYECNNVAELSSVIITNLSDAKHDNDAVKLLHAILSKQKYLVIESNHETAKHNEVAVSINSIFHYNQQNECTIALLAVNDITRIKKAERKIGFLSDHDILTGLYSRAMLEPLVKQMLAIAQRDKQYAALLFLNIDNFKHINTTYGQDIGDIVLKHAAERLVKYIRNKDYVVRVGADEFAILIGNLTNNTIAGTIAKKISDIIGNTFAVNTHKIRITVSIGISCYPYLYDDKAEANAIDFITNANIAMRAAKMQGRNNYVYFDKALQEGNTEVAEIEILIAKAIEHNLFFLVYQPIINVEDNSIYGMEALLRLKHTSGRIIPPDKFIPIIEQLGLMPTIGNWIIRTACLEYKQAFADLENANKTFPRLSINLSAYQLKDSKLIDTISEILIDTAVNPANIIFELTESAIISNFNNATILFNGFAQSNTRVAIDDFGTGYSSLSYLSRLNVNVLKIDKSFIDGIGNIQENNNNKIVRIILRLAKMMNLDVVAEGVETEAQKNILIRYSCKLIQGFLYSKPTTIAAVRQMMGFGSVTYL